MADWDPLCGTDWDPLLKQEFGEQKWAELLRCVEDERSRSEVYPPDDQVFAALCLTHCADTKVVIVGQDPYPREGQANGLAFAVPHGVPIPPSLANIHRELLTDVCVPIPDHGSLEGWPRQGVLLLNAALTVRAGAPRSHWRMWKPFTDAVIRVVDRKAEPVFILWGREAQKKTKALVDASQRTVIESSHPSPRAAHPSPRSNQRAFIGSGPFSRTNRALGGRGIDWGLFD